MPLKSTKLHRAKRLRNDEFYTQYQDIESECPNYLEHFFNKVIYCNCDTANSNFVKYFQKLKSQGLIKDILWSGGLNGLDFRSNASIELLKQSDIVAIMNSGQLFFDYPMELTELIYQITSDPNSHLLMATGDVSGMDCLTSDVVNCFENRIVFQTENPMFSNMLIGNDEATHLPSPDHYCQYSTKTNQIIIV